MSRCLKYFQHREFSKYQNIFKAVFVAKTDRYNAKLTSTSTVQLLGHKIHRGLPGKLEDVTDSLSVKSCYLQIKIHESNQKFLR